MCCHGDTHLQTCVVIFPAGDSPMILFHCWVWHSFKSIYKCYLNWMIHKVDEDFPTMKECSWTGFIEWKLPNLRIDKCTDSTNLDSIAYYHTWECPHRILSQVLPSQFDLALMKCIRSLLSRYTFQKWWKIVNGIPRYMLCAYTEVHQMHTEPHFK